MRDRRSTSARARADCRAARRRALRAARARFRAGRARRTELPVGRDERRCPQPGLLERRRCALHERRRLAARAAERDARRRTARRRDECRRAARGTSPRRCPRGAASCASSARASGTCAIGYDHIAFVLLLLLPSVLRPVDGKWQGATGFGAGDARHRHHHHRVHDRAFDHAGARGHRHREAADAADRSRDRRVDRRGGAAQSDAAPVAAAAAAGIRLRLRARLRLRECARRDRRGAAASLLPLLAGFNIGVEIAQLGIVALVLPLIYAMRGTRWYAAASCRSVHARWAWPGLVWLLQRV